VIVSEARGFNVGATESIDGSGLNVNSLDRGGFAVGEGVVGGMDYQQGLAVASPSLCSLAGGGG